MLIFDAHLDLAMNALGWNRDLTRPIGEIRARERGMTDKPDRGNGTVCLPEMRRGGIGICVATQIARYVKPGNPLPGWHSPEQAWAQTQGQLAWYRAMEEAGQMVQITNAAQLRAHVERWTQADMRADATGASRPQGTEARTASRPQTAPAEVAAAPRVAAASQAGPLPIGYILSLEGADSILTLSHLERSYAQGLRALGPAHYGPGIYAQGTEASGGLGVRGRELLAEMDRLGLILDATHLCDESFWEALDHFDGPVWASHQNCRALVPHGRQFADGQIKELIARGAVLGGCLDAWMLVPGWDHRPRTPASPDVRLEHLVNHLDHICQLAGNARHCGLGTDLDGEFGREQSPADLDTIADIARFEQLLAARGYSAADVAAIMHGNFLRFLSAAWDRKSEPAAAATA